MTTQMVRKQFYIHQRQEALLKRLAQERGVSEAEIIRQAIEHEAAGGAPTQQAAAVDRSAWQELVAFVEARRATAQGGEPYRWNREEIYAERESRWIRDRDKD